MYILMLEEIPATRAALPFPELNLDACCCVSNFSFYCYRLAHLSFLSSRPPHRNLLPSWPVCPTTYCCWASPPYASLVPPHRFAFLQKTWDVHATLSAFNSLGVLAPIFYVTTAIILFGLFFLANLEHAALYVFTHEVDIVDNRSNSVLCCPYNTLTLFHFYLMDATNFS